MKYVALLRGINVGGHSAVKMSVLKTAFEEVGFRNVVTYINSGNVIFETSDTSSEKLVSKVEELLKATFFPIKVVIISEVQLRNIIEKVPESWDGPESLRKYVGFIRPPLTPKEVLQEVELKEGIDFVEMGYGVIYMTTKMEGLTKSYFNKLIAKKVYQEITIRNFNTVQKLLSMLKNN